MSEVNLEQAIKAIIKEKHLDAKLYADVLDEFRHEGIPEGIEMMEHFPIYVDPEQVNQIVALRHAFIASELQKFRIGGQMRELDDILNGLPLMGDAQQQVFHEALGEHMMMERKRFLPILYEMTSQSGPGNPIGQVLTDDSRIAGTLKALGFGMESPD